MILIKCIKKRTIFNLLEIFSCLNCAHYLKDEEYFIGDQRIFTYRSSNGCVNEPKETLLDIASSKKVKLFLKDAILNQNKNLIFLWENDVFEDFENILSFDSDVHILVTN